MTINPLTKRALEEVRESVVKIAVEAYESGMGFSMSTLKKTIETYSITEGMKTENENILKDAMNMLSTLTETHRRRIKEAYQKAIEIEPIQRDSDGESD